MSELAKNRHVRGKLVYRTEHGGERVEGGRAWFMTTWHPDGHRHRPSLGSRHTPQITTTPGKLKTVRCASCATHLSISVARFLAGAIAQRWPDACRCRRTRREPEPTSIPKGIVSWMERE
jgi:hypothetical protein